MSAQIIDWVSDVTITTGAAATTLCSFVTSAGTAISCEVEVTGRNTATGAVIAGCRRLAARNVGGVLTQVGTTVTVGTDAIDTALAAAILTMDVSGTTIRVRVTGILAMNIEWFSDMRVRVN